MESLTALLLTLLLGIFIIIGSIITLIAKNSEKFIAFSIAIAFGVMTTLVVIDLIPEALESLEFSNPVYTYLIIILGSIMGFGLLKTLDHFIPDHDDDLTTTEDDDKNLTHIGLVSSIALVIHNIVEGMAIYILLSNNFKSGIMAIIGVGLHNIPLGMIITSTFYQGNKSLKKTMLIILGISLSTFVGGLLMCIPILENILETIEMVSLTLTIGMLLYIVIMELLPKIIHSKYKKITASGVFSGIGLLLLTLFL